jgi:hypothetical protein
VDYEVIGRMFSEDRMLTEFIVANEEINASSLGRVWQHVQKEKVSSWGIVTCYRDNKSQKENAKNFSVLKGTVRGFGLGFFVLEGHGQEENKEGKVTKVVEPSLFVPGISFVQIEKVAREWDQFGFVYSGPETKDKIVLFSGHGSESIGSFHPMRIAQFFSKVKGHPFVFSSVHPFLWDEPAQSNMERLWRHKQGYNNDKVERSTE